MKSNTATDTRKVLSTIDNVLTELREGIRPEELSVSDKSEVLKELDKARNIALSIKAKLKTDREK